MSLFVCSGCGCVENTALSNWAVRFLDKGADGSVSPPRCSACDPEIGRWHGEFKRRSAVGWVLGKDGHLYTREQFDSKQVHHTKPLRTIGPNDPLMPVGGPTVERGGL